MAVVSTAPASEGTTTKRAPQRPAIAAVPLALVVSGIYVAGVQTSFEALDLWLPLAGSTLTTILAFLPIAIMPGTGRKEN